MKKIVYVDMDGVLTDFEAGVGRLPDETRLEYAGEYQRVPGIFALLDPMPGAVEAFVELSALFDTYILSTAPWSNPSAWTDKLVWVQEHLGGVARKRLILTHHKYLNLGDYLRRPPAAAAVSRRVHPLRLFPLPGLGCGDGVSASAGFRRLMEGR